MYEPSDLLICIHGCARQHRHDVVDDGRGGELGGVGTGSLCAIAFVRCSLGFVHPSRNCLLQDGPVLSCATRSPARLRSIRLSLPLSLPLPRSVPPMSSTPVTSAPLCGIELHAGVELCMFYAF